MPKRDLEAWMSDLGVRVGLTLSFAGDTGGLDAPKVGSLGGRLDDALQAAGFAVVERAEHTFGDPRAVTIVRVLAESHIVLHTWPEHSLVTVDLFSCAIPQKTEHLVECLQDRFGGEVLSRTCEVVSARPKFR